MNVLGDEERREDALHYVRHMRSIWADNGVPQGKHCGLVGRGEVRPELTDAGGEVQAIDFVRIGSDGSLEKNVLRTSMPLHRDVARRESFNFSGFLLETLPAFAIVGKRLRKDLDGYRWIEARIGRDRLPPFRPPLPRRRFRKGLSGSRGQSHFSPEKNGGSFYRE
jgi:hypothetical protein